MYMKSTRSSAKRDVQKLRSAKRDDQIARPRRAQTCDQIFLLRFIYNFLIFLKGVTQVTKKRIQFEKDI